MTISAGEFGKRIEKARTAMGRQSLDCLVLSTAADVQYFSNCGQLIEGGVLVLPREGEPSLLTDQMYDYPRVKDASSIPDTRFTPDFAEGIPEAIQKKSVRGKVGVRARTLPTYIYWSISKLPNVLVEDASEFIRDLRLVKSSAEIELLEKAAKITEQGMEAAAKAIEPGRNEREISIAAETSMRSSGSDELAFPTVVGSGNRTTLIVPPPSLKRVRRGDLVLMDLGGRWRGYCGDMTRTKKCGTLKQAQKDLFEVVSQMYDAAIRAVKPGVKASEVHEAAVRVARESGYEEFIKHATGHGIGLEEHEKPRLWTGVGVELVPGVVHSVEPALYVPEIGGIRIEDVVVVTETGRKVLTSFNRDP